MENYPTHWPPRNYVESLVWCFECFDMKVVKQMFGHIFLMVERIFSTLYPLDFVALCYFVHPI